MDSQCPGEDVAMAIDGQLDDVRAMEEDSQAPPVDDLACDDDRLVVIEDSPAKPVGCGTEDLPAATSMTMHRGEIEGKISELSAHVQHLKKLQASRKLGWEMIPNYCYLDQAWVGTGLST